MRTLIQAFLVAFALLLTGISFGQKNVASVTSAQELIDVKKNGRCVVKLPTKYTKAEVADRAKYYTLYFTVDYNEAKQEATITMVENTARSRQIIERFLVVCDVDAVLVGDQTVATADLFAKYLND